MKKLLKFEVFILIFTIIFVSKAISADQILPIPKPIPDKEIKIKTAQKKRIFPEKKPSLKKEKVETLESKEIAEIEDVTKEQIFIYPEKKPVVFKKKLIKRSPNQQYYRGRILN